jgi:RNA polymerase sigma factor (sigma-70 family)
MPPPPSTSVASRLFLGPALRAQPDRRLVSLVRDGYESAFEEIVRRYGKPLGRYAAAIVSANRAEDVTQDAFSKALLALRDSDKEIELRPWLYRIVRNTALNDLRDQPPPTALLHEDIDGVETPLDAAERHEEINELVRRLRALPDPQRAAIVMRELEGLSHEEIAAALGMTGGAARQTIHRARRKLRDGAGLLVPIPLLHFLLGPSAEAAAAGAGLGGAAAAGAGVAAGGGGAGAGVALKAGVATVLVAGSVGTGVAIHESSSERGSARAAEESAPLRTTGDGSPSTTGTTTVGGSEDGHGGSGPGRHGEREPGDDRGGRHGETEGRNGGGSHGGPGPHSGSGRSGSGKDGSGGHSGSGHGGSEDSRSDSGHGGSGSSQSGTGTSGGSGSSGSGSSTSGSGSGSSGGGGSDSFGGGGSGSGSGSDDLDDG